MVQGMTGQDDSAALVSNRLINEVTKQKPPLKQF